MITTALRPSSRLLQPIRIPTLSGTPHPPAPYLSIPDSVDKIVKYLKEGKGKTAVLTGAGVSVDSGIRAYRGKNGSYTVNKKHRPIFYGEFIEQESKRRRYWARSYLGYPPVRVAEANPTHFALAALHELGYTNQLITQNVDGLHHKAADSDEHLRTYLAPAQVKPTVQTAAGPPGTPPILELHGTLRHAHCLSCGTPTGRDAFQDRLSHLNPDWAKYATEIQEGREERLNPDGDVELPPGMDYETFNVPACDSCGGPMKPRVVFFGESLEPHVREAANQFVAQNDQLLVVGSSLATFSAFRLLKQMKEHGGSVGLLNVGESRGDPIVAWRVGHEDGAGAILPEVARRLFREAVEQNRLSSKQRRTIETMLKSGVVKPLPPGRRAAS